VIAISNWTKSQVVAHYGIKPEKIDVLYNWVRPACQKPVSAAEIDRVRQRYGLPGRFIAYLGGYRAYKNVEFLMDAWRRATQRALVPPLVLAGQIPRETENGYYCDIPGALNRLGLGASDVLQPGLIADEDLPAFYASASLFVSPSRLEGFGYPAVEAMACRVPTLVSDASVYPELITEEHLRFSLANPEMLAERILAALADPQRFSRAVDPRFTETHGKFCYEQIVRSVAELR
jgi:glycosyltransferase involved in cell wall biosynthesis